MFSPLVLLIALSGSNCKGEAGDLTVSRPRDLALISTLSWCNCQKGIHPQTPLEAD